MKTCKHEGCTNFVFSHGYCKYHQSKRPDKEPKRLGFKPYKPRSTKKRYKIPPVSNKRLNEGKTYSMVCKELEAEIRAENDGCIYCFFTGLEIKERIAWHHLRGRDGDLLTDKRWLVPTINYYHLFWHGATVEQLKDQWWYEGFLQRLKEKDNDLFLKELKKQEKR